MTPAIAPLNSKSWVWAHSTVPIRFSMKNFIFAMKMWLLKDIIPWPYISANIAPISPNCFRAPGVAVEIEQLFSKDSEDEEVSVDSISQVCLSHRAFVHEAQPKGQLDCCLVVFWQHRRDPPKLGPQGKIPERIKHNLLTTPQSAIEHHDVYVAIQPRTYVCCRRKTNHFVVPHELIELVSRAHHPFPECLECPRNQVVEQLGIQPHPLPQVF